MDYQINCKPPRRDLNLGKPLPISWNLNVPNQEMRDCLEYITRMDPMLDYDGIASIIMEKYGNFMCGFCYSPMVMDGKNESGIGELMCRSCKRKIS